MATENLDFFTYPAQQAQATPSEVQDEAARMEEEEIRKAIKELEKEKKLIEQVDKLVDPLRVDADTDIEADTEPLSPLVAYVKDRFETIL